MKRFVFMMMAVVMMIAESSTAFAETEVCYFERIPEAEVEAAIAVEAVSAEENIIEIENVEDLAEVAEAAEAVEVPCFVSDTMEKPILYDGEWADAIEPTYSKNWFLDESGNWKIKDDAGNNIRNAWLNDEAIGKWCWYLLNTDGTIIAAELVQDNTGNYYSLGTGHDGAYGMLNYVSGVYDGIYIEFSRKHDGTFGAILNQSAIDALKAKYGVLRVDIGNESCVSVR